ncbi:MAG: AsmA family protein, partial [Algiphilus sp.]|nr:AsmA family protein [Algiphilus sp.]
MRKFLKFFGIGLAALVLLLAAGLTAAALLFDPNDYRDQIAQAVSDQTGREFRIEGPLSLSVFPWLAVDAGAMELANAKGFEEDGPFARFERAAVGIELMPL